RNLAVLACEIERGIPAHRVLAGVWEKRRAIVQKALERHERAEWRRLLCLSAHSERVIKGQAAGRPWDELLNLSVKLAGLKPPGSGHSNSRERHHRA
ncbi:MAG: DNA polymerase III subunit delta, partial [Gammaproteobacteria bacterium]|nr:DNA polymerase III subunit delta [Gammaproteobacteria bacterium]